MEVCLFVCRILLGSIFIMSAIGKMLAPKWFVSNVIKYRVLPVRLATVYGWCLPYLEIGVAITLLTGWQAKWGAVVAVPMLVSFAIAVTIVMLRHENLSCSCFGLLYQERVGWPTLVRDLVLVGSAVYILIADSGATTISTLISGEAPIGSVLPLTVTAIALVGSVALAVFSARKSFRLNSQLKEISVDSGNFPQ